MTAVQLLLLALAEGPQLITSVESVFNAGKSQMSGEDQATIEAALAQAKANANAAGAQLDADAKA